MKSVEQALGNDTDLHFILDTENSLNEVVVTGLYIKKETKRLGYSLQEIKGEDLVKARDPNPIASLVGKVAGVNVGVKRKPHYIICCRWNADHYGHVEYQPG